VWVSLFATGGVEDGLSARVTASTVALARRQCKRNWEDECYSQSVERPGNSLHCRTCETPMQEELGRRMLFSESAVTLAESLRTGIRICGRKTSRNIIQCSIFGSSTAPTMPMRYHVCLSPKESASLEGKEQSIKHGISGCERFQRCMDIADSGE
jgi:hypothetical protein